MKKTSKRLFRAVGVYSLILGAVVIMFWTLILSRENVEEGDTEMIFHLVSEMVMASLCVGSGLGLVNGLRRAIPINLIAHSMVIYSVLNAAGYYAEREELIMVLLFLILLVLSLAILLHMVKYLGGFLLQGPPDADHGGGNGNYNTQDSPQQEKPPG